MIIESKCRLAIHALVDLGTRETKRPVKLASVATRQHISLSYLEQLFRRLRIAGLVGSTRGPGGGYYVSRPLSAISVADVMRAVDDEPDDRNDVMKSRGQLACLTQDLWGRVDEYLQDYLATVTLDSIADSNRAALVKADGAAVAKGQTMARQRGRGQFIPSVLGLAFRNELSERPRPSILKA